MKSIKTAFVVVVMLVVVYGVWVMINKQPLAPPPGAANLANWNPSQINYGQGNSSMPQVPPPLVEGPGSSLQVAEGSGSGVQAGTQGQLASDSAHRVMPHMAPSAAVTPTNPSYASPYSGSSTSNATRSAAPVINAGEDTRQLGIASAYAQGGEQGSDSRYASQSGAESKRASTASIYDNPVHNSSEPTGQASGRGVSPESLAGTGFSIAWSGVQDQLANGELAEALSTLSLWHGSNDVPTNLRSEMVELLDQLAGEVIYSRKHFLEPAYRVQPGENLDDIASQYQIPTQLLANINGISDPSRIRPGTTLKVIRGPFKALVSLEQQELTLVVDGRYAGRFAVGVGNDPMPRTGEFVVREKTTERTFYDRDGRAVPPGDDANPYGPYWIGLEGQLGIHGAAPAPRSGQRTSTGSIIVSPDDARDLYAILSSDSQVIIRR